MIQKIIEWIIPRLGGPSLETVRAPLPEPLFYKKFLRLILVDEGCWSMKPTLLTYRFVIFCSWSPVTSFFPDTTQKDLLGLHPREEYIRVRNFWEKKFLHNLQEKGDTNLHPSPPRNRNRFCLRRPESLAKQRSAFDKCFWNAKAQTSSYMYPRTCI